MKTRSKSVLLAALTAFLALVLVPVLTNASETPALSGRVVDMQGQPVQGAHVALFLGNSLEPHAEQETDRVGQFVLDLPDSPVDGARIEVSRLHFEPATWQADQTEVPALGCTHTGCQNDSLLADARPAAGDCREQTYLGRICKEQDLLRAGLGFVLSNAFFSLRRDPSLACA